jgi:hypothetical protein
MFNLESLIFKILGLHCWLLHPDFGIIVSFGLLSTLILVLKQLSHFKFSQYMTHNCVEPFLLMFNIIFWDKFLPLKTHVCAVGTLCFSTMCLVSKA